VEPIHSQRPETWQHSKTRRHSALYLHLATLLKKIPSDAARQEETLIIPDWNCCANRIWKLEEWTSFLEARAKKNFAAIPQDGKVEERRAVNCPRCYQNGHSGRV
jgi:hypothetical protein